VHRLITAQTDEISANAGFDAFDDDDHDARNDSFLDASDFIVDIREYDVPYHVRVAIDLGKPTDRTTCGKD
jgi:DNA polymerase elongation subunit (family B)